MNIILHRHINTGAFFFQFFIYIQRYKLVKVLLITRLCSLFPPSKCVSNINRPLYILLYITNRRHQFPPCCNTTCINYGHNFFLPSLTKINIKCRLFHFEVLKFTSLPSVLHPKTPPLNRKAKLFFFPRTRESNYVYMLKQCVANQQKP